MVDIEKLAEQAADKHEWDFESPEGNGYSDFTTGFVEGYKAYDQSAELDKVKKLLTHITEYFIRNLEVERSIGCYGLQIHS